MIVKFLLNILMICKMSIKILSRIKEKKVLMVLDDMISDIISSKQLHPIVSEMFVRGRKLNISLAFITQSHFEVTKDVRLNSSH